LVIPLPFDLDHFLSRAVRRATKASARRRTEKRRALKTALRATAPTFCDFLAFARPAQHLTAAKQGNSVILKLDDPSPEEAG
jgi:hypothetical protein